MPLELRYLAQALDDLEAIHRAIAEKSHSRTIASDFVERIHERCEAMTTFPYSGRPRDDLAPGLRTIAFERRAVIAYVVDEKALRTTNIFQEAAISRRSTGRTRRWPERRAQAR